MNQELVYTTDLGRAYKGDAREILTSGSVVPGSVDLIVTSPPFALTRPKDYGNRASEEYVDWLMSFVPSFQQALSDTGSLVLDIGGAYLPGIPKRSTYHFEVAVRLAKALDFCQEFYWFNPGKLPSPAEWVTVRRLRVKDSVNLVLWLAKDATKTKANNHRVLREYSTSMKSLLRKGYQARLRTSNWRISDNFKEDHGGAIPDNLVLTEDPNEADVVAPDILDNLITLSNIASRNRYLDECRRLGIKPHNARFPFKLPDFFIKFLTEPGDLVCDPFAGSNTTGAAAEAAGRRWVSCDLDAEGRFAGSYVRTSAFWFQNARFEPGFEAPPVGNWQSKPRKVRPAPDVSP